MLRLSDYELLETRALIVDRECVSTRIIRRARADYGGIEHASVGALGEGALAGGVLNMEELLREEKTLALRPLGGVGLEERVEGLRRSLIRVALGGAEGSEDVWGSAKDRHGDGHVFAKGGDKVAEVGLLPDRLLHLEGLRGLEVLGRVLCKVGRQIGYVLCGVEYVKEVYLWCHKDVVSTFSLKLRVLGVNDQKVFLGAPYIFRRRRFEAY